MIYRFVGSVPASKKHIYTTYAAYEYIIKKLLGHTQHMRSGRNGLFDKRDL